MNYTSRHLITAHGVILRLQKNPRVQLAQIDGKDIIAEALADAERAALAPWEALAEWERSNINRAVTVEPVTDTFLMCAGDGDDGATGNGTTATEAALSLCEGIGIRVCPVLSMAAQPACSCGAANEPDYSNGDHDDDCPAKRKPTQGSARELPRLR